MREKKKISSEMRKRRISLFALFFWVFWLIGSAHLARGQPSAYVTVADTSLASGNTYQEVTVLLQNDVSIKGIELWFSLGVPSVTDFTTEYIQVDTMGESPNQEIVVVRNCKIQTVGTLVENFDWIKAHGEVRDTAFLDCDWVKVAGMAKEGGSIPPGTGVLLRLYIDLLCTPDTVQDPDRMAAIFVNGKLSDPEGNLVETQFTNGIIYLNRTVCGNLTDCICGDTNADGRVSIVDVVYLINWLFDEGPDLCPEIMGDVNLYRGVSVSDIVYLINYLFNDGPAPVCIRKY